MGQRFLPTMKHERELTKIRRVVERSPLVLILASALLLSYVSDVLLEKRGGSELSGEGFSNGHAPASETDVRVPFLVDSAQQ